MTPADTLAVLDLSLALARNDEPIVHCDAHRFNKWGWRAVTCCLPIGHPFEHIDTHAGRRFTDKEVAS